MWVGKIGFTHLILQRVDIDRMMKESDGLKAINPDSMFSGVFLSTYRESFYRLSTDHASRKTKTEDVCIYI